VTRSHTVEWPVLVFCRYVEVAKILHAQGSSDVV